MSAKFESIVNKTMLADTNLLHKYTVLYLFVDYSYYIASTPFKQFLNLIDFPKIYGLKIYH